MFRSRRRLHHLHRLHDLHADMMGLAPGFRGRGPWAYSAVRPPRRRRGPSWAMILLAGLAGLALVQLMSAAERPRRSTLERVLIGVLLLAAAALVLRFRRNARRYAW